MKASTTNSRMINLFNTFTLPVLTIISQKPWLKLIIASVLLGSLSACSWFQFPGVYRLDIQQGNIVTQEMVDQLKSGMTKRQVNFVLGTPLVQDSFNQDRWDYYYSLRNSKREFDNKRFTVYFDNDQLVRTEGDYTLPSGDTETINADGSISNDANSEELLPQDPPATEPEQPFDPSQPVDPTNSSNTL